MGAALDEIQSARFTHAHRDPHIQSNFSQEAHGKSFQNLKDIDLADGLIQRHPWSRQNIKLGQTD